MWDFLNQLFGKKPGSSKHDPWVSTPVTNVNVMKYHPFFQQDPEKWIVAWLDTQKAAGTDYYALVKANPRCRIFSVVDALCYDLADLDRDCFHASWQFYYPQDMPVGYLAELYLVRIAWEDPDGGKKQVRHVDVSMIYRDLVQAGIIDP